MKKFYFRVTIILVTTLSTAFQTPALADALLSAPPDHFVVSPGNVDMRSGRYMYTQTDLSIGGDSGLSLTRTLAQQVAGHISPFGSFSHNFDMMVVETRVSIFNGDFRHGHGVDYQIQVAFGGLSQTFRSPAPAGYNYAIASAGRYGILTYAAGDRAAASTVYTYQSADGMTAVFRQIGSGDCSPTLRCAFVSQLTRTDGTRLDFSYDTAGTGTNKTRLRSITSTRGHALLFEYSGTSMNVSKACLLNLAVTPKPANNVCPAGVPTATYTYVTVGGRQRLASATDASSAVWGFVNTASSIGFKNPGESSPWLTNQISLWTDDDGTSYDIVNSQSFADGRSYSYLFTTSPPVVDHIPTLAGGSFTDGQGNGTTVEYDYPIRPGSPAPGQQCTHFPCSPYEIEDAEDNSVRQMTPGPVWITDPLNRTTTNDYCDQYAKTHYPATEHNRCLVLPKPQVNTDPGGIKTYMKWDLAAGLLLESRQVARAGSGLTDLIRSATYNCGAMTCFEKPTSLTDAKFGKTEYTYAPAHGGVLTEWKPAPSSGAARPLKVTTWTSKYAYIKSGTSLVQAASPVWVIASETECQSAPSSTSPVCDNTKPKRVTTYEYGANGTANNLNARGIVVTADGESRRTCFSYDDQGNRVSQTSPRAGLTTCP